MYSSNYDKFIYVSIDYTIKFALTDGGENLHNLIDC